MTLLLVFIEENSKYMQTRLNGSSFPHQMASASLSFALTRDTEEANTSHQHFILH